MFLFPSLFLPLSLSHSLYLSLSLNQASQYEMEKCLKKQKNSQRWEISMPFVRWLSSKNEAELYLCRLSELLNLNMKFLVCYIPSLFLSLVCFSFFFFFSCNWGDSRWMPQERNSSEENHYFENVTIKPFMHITQQIGTETLSVDIWGVKKL